MATRHRRLRIEWRHLEVGGVTCDRCDQTGKAILEAMERLRRDLNTGDVAVEFVDTALTPGDVSDSNMVLFNGRPLESLLAQSAVAMTPCVSCGCLLGQETRCRAVVQDGVIHESLTADMIHAAALAALAMGPGDGPG